MRLVSLEVRDFHSYETRQVVRFERDLTLLAGRNNVGKTSLLLAVRQPIAPQQGAGPTLQLRYTWQIHVDELTKSVWVERFDVFRPSLEEITRTGMCQMEAQIQTPTPIEHYSGANFPGAVPSRVGGYEFGEISVGDTNLRLKPFRRMGEGGQPIYLWWEDAAVAEHADTYIVASQLHGFLVSLLQAHYYIQPRRKTEPMGFTTTTELSPDGGNLTTVVATLYTNYRHTMFRELEEFMRSVFPEIQHVEVHMGGGPPPTAEIRLALGRKGGLNVPLRFCGTGIEQALMLATAVLTAPAERVFLIDEPHAFLHPYAERGVLRFMRAHPKHQYIVATHSPAFLTAYPVTHARLITMEDDGSHVADVSGYAAILAEVGITAADLWSADSILWVEGPSEVEVAKVLIDPLTYEVPVSVRAMPDAVRNAARSEKQARQAIEFCGAVSRAVLPVQVRMLFLFDSDERREPLKEDVVTATGGRARFLPCRELENLFLSVPALHADISALCAGLGLAEPAPEDIQAELDEMLAQTEDPALYPNGAIGADRLRVVGSEVLQRLYWKWATSNYDKVGDGSRLAKAVLAVEPTALEPFQAVVQELGTRTA